MADTNLTGATVAVETDATKAAKALERKKYIKWAIIAVVLVAGFFLVKKYVLKK